MLTRLLIQPRLRLRIRRQYVEASPWDIVPGSERSRVRSYINSENEKDREYTQKLCKKYGLDYADTRLVIIREMVEESERIAKRKERQAAQLF